MGLHTHVFTKLYTNGANRNHDIDTTILQIAATVQTKTVQFETVQIETVQIDTVKTDTGKTENDQTEETIQSETIQSETIQSKPIQSDTNSTKPKLDHRSLEIPPFSSSQRPILTKPIFKKTYFCNYKCGAYFENINDLKIHLEMHPVILIRIEPTTENLQKNRPLQKSTIQQLTIQNPDTSHFDRSIPPSPNSELDIDAIIDELDEQYEGLSPESQNSVSDKKRTYTKITPEIKKQVVKRYTEGNINQSEISRILEISGTSVRKILMKRGLIKPLRRPGGRSKSRRKKNQ